MGTALESHHRPVQLNAYDRCDQCGVQALVRVHKVDNAAAELLFCGHHKNEHFEALVLDGWSFV